VRDAGFEMQLKSIRLQPQQKLIEIIRKSQESALAGEGGEHAGGE